MTAGDRKHLTPRYNPALVERFKRIQSFLSEGEPNKRELLLYIEPKSRAAEEPLLDELTGKITSAFRSATDTGERWRGYHRCNCGALSDNTDYILPSGHQTNSLAIHYLALHREDVPPEQLELVAAFECDLAEPVPEEIKQPEQLQVRIVGSEVLGQVFRGQ